MKAGLRNCIRYSVIAALCSALVSVSNAADEPGTSALNSAELALERQNFEQWQAQREISLTSPTGWLTLTGLYWLKPGKNTFGSDKSNTLQLDNKALAPQAGVFILDASTVHFVASENAGVTFNGEPVTDIEMAADTTDDPTVLQSGSLLFYLIERVGNPGIRVLDSENPDLTDFQGLSYFPFKDDWVLDARFEPYQPHKKIPIVNVTGMREDMDSPGAAVFSHGGIEYRLDTLLEDPADTELFIMFADATSGEETYGAGRFMYVPLPHNGLVRLNFNEAYNPPCAFSAFATCPLPPIQNQLRSLRVDAGELSYSPAHQP